MKNLIRLSLLILLMTEFAWAQKTGNGGAGVRRNGTYMTFGSAGLWTETLPEELENIPGLDKLISVIADSRFFIPSVKSELMKALLPSRERKYYQVQKDKFDLTTEKRLIAEYRRAIKSEGDDLVLFAVTDTASKVTYLLPSYYELSEVEQMAILFHEAFWILQPKATYQQVIAVEVNMQKYLENPQNADNLRPVIEALSGYHPTHVYLWALEVDRLKKVDNGTAVDTKTQSIALSLETYLGSKYLECVYTALKIPRAPLCDHLLTEHAVYLKRNYPHSQFIQLFSQTMINSSHSEGHFWRSEFKYNGEAGELHLYIPADGRGLPYLKWAFNFYVNRDWNLGL